MERITSSEGDAAIKDGYRLSSGRFFYAFNGVLGITPDAKLAACLYEGSDGTVIDDQDVYEEWSLEERREIAAYMITLWQQWADNHLT